MRDNLTSLRKHEIQPLGVNPGDAKSHRAFRNEHEFPFELLVDDKLEVARAYGAVKDDGSGNARSVVVIGKNGNVIFSESGAPAMQRVINAVKSAEDSA